MFQTTSLLLIIALATADAFLWNPICDTFFAQRFVGSIFCKTEDNTPYPDLTQEKTEMYIGLMKEMLSDEDNNAKIGPYMRGAAPEKHPKGKHHKKRAKDN